MHPILSTKESYDRHVVLCSFLLGVKIHIFMDISL